MAKMPLGLRALWTSPSYSAGVPEFTTQSSARVIRTMAHVPSSPAAVNLPQVATRLLDFAQLHPALPLERSA